MTKYKNRTTFSSFKYALRGILLAIKSQKNVRTGFLIGLLVIFCAILLDFTFIEIALTIIAISFVVFAELINTTIEFVMDTYYGNRHSSLAGMSKDIAAGTVLFAIFNAAVIGMLLFIPKIWYHINSFLYIIYP